MNLPDISLESALHLPCISLAGFAHLFEDAELLFWWTIHLLTFASALLAVADSPIQGAASVGVGVVAVGCLGAALARKALRQRSFARSQARPAAARVSFHRHRRAAAAARRWRGLQDLEEEELRSGAGRDSVQMSAAPLT